MQLRPLNDWIILQEIKNEENVTSTGIILSNDGLVQVGRGNIISISDKVRKEFMDSDGVELNVGDEVIFSKYQAEEVKIKDAEGKWLERVKCCYKFALQAKIAHE